MVSMLFFILFVVLRMKQQQFQPSIIHSTACDQTTIIHFLFCFYLFIYTWYKKQNFFFVVLLLNFSIVLQKNSIGFNVNHTNHRIVIMKLWLNDESCCFYFSFFLFLVMLLFLYPIRIPNIHNLFVFVFLLLLTRWLQVAGFCVTLTQFSNSSQIDKQQEEKRSER